jgi:peptide deformylase
MSINIDYINEVLSILIVSVNVIFDTISCVYQLRAVNEEIIVFDDALVQNAREMLMIMHASEGVGLAAPQVCLYICIHMHMFKDLCINILKDAHQRPRLYQP